MQLIMENSPLRLVIILTLLKYFFLKSLFDNQYPQFHICIVKPFEKIKGGEVLQKRIKITKSY
jgi:hypothetical protein